MLSSMRAVVTPQTVINGCMDAVQATGLGRSTLMDMPFSLIDHFGFCVHPDEYAAVSMELQGMLDRACTSELPDGSDITMGLQKQNGRPLSWFHGNPLPALAAVDPQGLPIQAGGGYVAVHADLTASAIWLHQHEVEFQILQPYGVGALWVPLRTPEWGVGPGYYALCVVTESLFQTTLRLPTAA